MKSTMVATRVDDWMTVNPRSVRTHETIAEALEIMRRSDIRHLPVLDRGGQLVGVVSERDLILMETLRSVDPTREPVEEAMTPDPFTIALGTPLAEVAEQMARHKYGSAVVMDAGRVVGIVTTVDLARALTHLARG
jgi:acetoin utilization protein AcuB